MTKDTTTQERLDSIIAEASKEKRHCIGAVYRASTGAVVDLLGAINTLASAGHSLAQQAEVTAMLGLQESAKEFHESTQDGGLEAILSTREMMKALRALR